MGIHRGFLAGGSRLSCVVAEILSRLPRTGTKGRNDFWNTARGVERRHGQAWPAVFWKRRDRRKRGISGPAQDASWDLLGVETVEDLLLVAGGANATTGDLPAFMARPAAAPMPAKLRQEVEAYLRD